MRDKKAIRRTAALAGGFLLLAGAAVALVVWRQGAVGAAAPAGSGEGGAQTSTTFAMDTVVTQTCYGENAAKAMRRVNIALAEWDARLSLFQAEGDIARINAGAGGPVRVAEETADLLRRALALVPRSEEAFALTIAPVTLAWGVTTNAPRVPPQSELDALLPLVDDAGLTIEGNTVTLARPGMGIDLGGIAKGAACDMAAEIYAECGMDSGLLWVGGNTYARGVKPDGSPFRIGFENPQPGGEAYVASFLLTDAVIAVSGGYNRYFEAEGERYIHIFDPATGRPAESDILSVGAVCPGGAEADFWSTTLYVWGLERTLAHMRAGGTALVLDKDGKLWVSESLKAGFRLNERAGVAEVEFVPGG